MFWTKGYYALTYCIGIHFLNSFIAFISPLDDPDDDLPEDSSHLPQSNTEEFRPFQRKLKDLADSDNMDTLTEGKKVFNIEKFRIKKNECSYIRLYSSIN